MFLATCILATCVIGMHGRLGGRRVSPLLTESVTRLDKPREWGEFECHYHHILHLRDPEGEIYDLSTYEGLFTGKLNKVEFA